MKTSKMTIIGMVLLVCSTGVMAQSTTKKHTKNDVATVQPITPPASVDSAFQSKFSGSTATWMKTPAGNYCATLASGSGKEYVEYSPDGKWLRNATDITTDQLTDIAKNAIQTQFPGMEIAAVQKLEYENIDPFYKVDLKQGDQSKSVMVNAAGFIEQ
jgi:uncharacterized membrane protein YkoI